MTLPTHIVNVSGGKDSQACALLAARRGKPFRLVMADTGNEHPATFDHAHYIADFVGVPLEVYRADFTDRIAGKRRFVAEKWPGMGVPDEVVARALDALHPTGNPFLDLCLWKGRFPSRMAQFCTSELKVEPIRKHVIDPALRRGPVVQWLGVRRDESRNRANAPRLQRVTQPKTHDMWLYSPIIHWTAQNVISFAQACGMEANPLYRLGMSRVGCFPCINCSKSELAQIGHRFPEAVDRIKAWEVATAAASKRGLATFFAPGSTPEGAAMAREVKRLAEAAVRKSHPNEPAGPRRKALLRLAANEASALMPWPDAIEVFRWATTERGGRQWGLLDNDDFAACSSEYGLCE